MYGAFVDNYNSVWPDKSAWSDSAELFQVELTASLDQWQQAGHPRVWLKLAQKQVQLVPVATQLGFDFHQVQDGDLLLIKRLVPDAVVPKQASHHVGAGGLVTNAKGELLVIAEAQGGRTGTYKSPEVMLSKASILLPASYAKSAKRLALKQSLNRLC